MKVWQLNDEGDLVKFPIQGIGHTAKEKGCHTAIWLYSHGASVEGTWTCLKCGQVTVFATSDNAISLATPKEIHDVMLNFGNRKPDVLTDNLPNGDGCGWWKRNGEDAYCGLMKDHETSVHSWKVHVPARRA